MTIDDKLSILLDAYAEARQDDPLQEELLDAAREALSLHPGITQSDFVRTLLHNYGTEVTDALGRDLPTIYATLHRLWHQVQKNGRHQDLP